jgi:hypothetical protein
MRFAESVSQTDTGGSPYRQYVLVDALPWIYPVHVRRAPFCAKPSLQNLSIFLVFFFY